MSISRKEWRLLAAHMLQWDLSKVFLHENELLQDQDFLITLQPAIERRLKGEPIAKIVGFKEFYGRNFFTNQYTLDPRPDSETLIQAVIEDGWDKKGPIDILELGLGTGCLLWTLLLELPDANGVGVDISEEALKIAEQNQQRYSLQQRSNILQSDWLGSVSGKWDIIISNPPYIENHALLSTETLHDPALALFAGNHGLDAYKKILKDISSFLKSTSKVYLEIGCGQKEAVNQIAKINGLKLERVYNDLAGIERILCYIMATT